MAIHYKQFNPRDSQLDVDDELDYKPQELFSRMHL